MACERLELAFMPVAATFRATSPRRRSALTSARFCTSSSVASPSQSPSCPYAAVAPPSSETLSPAEHERRPRHRAPLQPAGQVSRLQRSSSAWPLPKRTWDEQL